MRNECTAALYSVTDAIKAEKLLAKDGIDCEIIKIDPRRTPRGCAYGVALPCSRSSRADRILRQAGVEHRILSERPENDEF